MDNTPQEAPEIHWRIENWFPELSDECKTLFRVYHQSLIELSRTASFISPKTLLVADALYFADSIMASRIIYSHLNGQKSVSDFGSGLGFPGVVFALLYPDVQVTLVESDSKKIEFLKELVLRMDLKNIKILHSSVEALAESSVSVAITRGFANISKTILAARKCIPKGGVLFHLKGEEWGIEVVDIPSQLCSIWAPALVGEYKLPVGAAKFAVIKTDKIA